jgi:hypothetical protein
MLALLMWCSIIEPFVGAPAVAELERAPTSQSQLTSPLRDPFRSSDAATLACTEHPPAREQLRNPFDRPRPVERCSRTAVARVEPPPPRSTTPLRDPFSPRARSAASVAVGYHAPESPLRRPF